MKKHLSTILLSLLVIAFFSKLAIDGMAETKFVRSDAPKMHILSTEKFVSAEIKGLNFSYLTRARLEKDSIKEIFYLYKDNEKVPTITFVED